MTIGWPQQYHDGKKTCYNPNATGITNQPVVLHEPNNYSQSYVCVLATSDEYILQSEDDNTVHGVSPEPDTFGFPINPNWKVGSFGLTPVVSENTITYTDGFHMAERAADRTEWNRSSVIQSAPASSGLISDGEDVFMGTAGGSEHDIGDVYRFNTETKKVDHVHGSNAVSNLLVTESKIIWMSGPAWISATGSVLAFDRDDKEIAWSIDFEDKFVHPRLAGNNLLYTVCFGRENDDHRHGRDGSVYLTAYSLSDGHLEWESDGHPMGIETSQRRYEKEDPGFTLIRDILYISTSDKVTAINSYTGETLWSYERESQSGIARVDETRIIGTLEALYVSGPEPIALDPDSGDLLWSFESPLTFHAAISDEVLATGSEEGLYVLSSSESDSHTDETNVYDTCPTCDANIAQYENPSFCPSCGTEIS